MYSVFILFVLISLAVINLTNFDLELNLIDFILIGHVLMLKSLDQNLKNQIPVYFWGISPENPQKIQKSPKIPKNGGKRGTKINKKWSIYEMVEEIRVEKK